MISQRVQRPSTERSPAEALRNRNEASYDLLVVGGPLAIALAHEAVRLGARVAIGLEPGALGEHNSSVSARRAMIRLGGRNRQQGREFFEQWAAERRSASPAHDQLATLDSIRESATLVQGRAVFTGKNTCALHGREIRFDKAIVAPACAPLVPVIAGLDKVGYVTEFDWHLLEQVPHRVAVLGSGDAACELAQALARAGAETHLIACGARLLEPFGASAVQMVVDSLTADGVRVHQQGACLAAESVGRMKSLTIAHADQRRKVFVDEIVVASGRATVTDRMGLGIAGIKTSGGSIVADAHLRTANSRIFAVDETQLNPCNAASVAAACVRNALLTGHLTVDHRTTTCCVLTEPQLAMIARQSERATHGAGNIETLRGTAEMLGNWPALTEPFEVELSIARKSGRIVGATLAGGQAADLAMSLVVGMQRGITLRTLAVLPAPDTTGARILQQLGRNYVDACARDTQRAPKWGRKWRPGAVKLPQSHA